MATEVAAKTDRAVARGEAASFALRALWLLAGSVAVAGLCWLSFGAALGFGFMAIDDPGNFLENAYLRPLRLEGLRVIWTEPYWGLYTPITSTVWGVEMHLAEDAASGEIDARLFHAVSLVLHVACALLVWRIVVRVGAGLLAAWIAAGLFVVHPFNAEVVCWASETKGLLAGLFGFLAVERFIASRHGDSSWGRWLNYSLATLAFGAALLSKPNAAAVPLMVAVIDVGLLRSSWRQTFVAMLPWLVLAGALVWVTRGAQGGSNVADVVPLWQRPVIAGDAVTFYLAKLLWPVELGPDYGRAPSLVLAGPWVYGLAAVPLIVIAVLAILPGRRLWLSGFFVFVAGLLPTLGLVAFVFQDHSTVADRYVYLALLGPALVLAFALTRLNARLGDSARNVTLVAAAVAVVALVSLSRRQAQVWSSDVAWAEQAVRVFDRSLAGNEVLAQLAETQGDHERAMEIRRRQVDEMPDSPLARVYLGRALLRTGETKAALDAFREAQARHERSPAVRQWLAQAHLDRGEYEEALEQLTLAIAWSGKDPADDDRHGMLAEIHLEMGDLEAAEAAARMAIERNPPEGQYQNLLGRILHRRGATDAALAAMREAIRLSPRSAVPHRNLGVIYLELSQPDDAVEEFRIALELEPADNESRKHLCIALDRLERIDEVIATCREALAADPNWCEGRYLLASRLVTHPDEAVRRDVDTLVAARELCERTRYREPQAIEILAAAYAATENFTLAADMTKRAVALYEQRGQTQQARQAAQRLDEYRQKASL